MKTSEIYGSVLHAVAEVTGYSECEILESNREEHADARFLLVTALAKMLSDSEIARLTGMSRKGVAYIRSCDYKMKKWLVGRNWAEIRKILESSWDGTGK